MSFMNWNESYSVGVETIDRQHSGLFAMINELHDAMMKGQGKTVVGSLLERLIKYTVEHFAYEEAMMGTANYPSLAAHRSRHADLTRQVEEFRARCQSGDGTVNVELLPFLSGWLTRHIQLEDKEYGPWMNSHGVH